MTKSYSYYCKALILLFIVLGLGVLFAPKTEAIASRFPDPASFSAGGTSSTGTAMAVVSSPTCRGSGCGGLTAEETSYKIFRPKPGGAHNPRDLTVKLLEACVDLALDKPAGTLPNILASPFAVDADGEQDDIVGGWPQPTARNYGSTKDRDCVGRDLVLKIPARYFSSAQSARWGNEWETAILGVDKADTNYGLKLFQIRVMESGAYVTFEDLGSVAGDESYDDLEPSAFKAMALLEGDNDAPGAANFQFKFKPDCKYQAGRDVYLKWSDADNNDASSGADYDDNISWTAKGFGVNKFRPDYDDSGPRSTLGGQDWESSAANTENIGPLTFNEEYTWTWKDVNKTNGVQLWMPFSEGSIIADCPPPPAGRAAICGITDPGVLPTGKSFELDAVFKNTGGTNLYVGERPGAPKKSPNMDDTYNYGIQFSNNGYGGGPDFGFGQWDFGRPPIWNRPAFPYAGQTGQSGKWVVPGENFAVKIPLLAPSNPSTYRIDFYTTHIGYVYTDGARATQNTDTGFVGAYCSITLKFGKEFTMTATASVPNFDKENPESGTYGGSVVTAGIPTPPTTVNAKVTYAFFNIDRGGRLDGYYADGPRPWGNGPSNYSRSISSFPAGTFRAGERFCSQINVEILAPPYPGGGSPKTDQVARGYVGPNGEVSTKTGGTHLNCERVINLPYLRAYGADVAACSLGAKIDAYTETLGGGNFHPSKSGSGVQFAALAYSSINGFTSANMRNPPYSTYGLTFANSVAGTTSGVVGGDPNRPKLGGGYGSALGVPPGCGVDYYEETKYPSDTPGRNDDNDATPHALSLSALKTNEQTVVRDGPGDARITITDGVDFNKRHSVYVDGDVYINSNITYGSTIWNNVDEIPNFALIVRGNIYIAPGVTQLDGLYVAQAKVDGSKGTIFTCSPGLGDEYDGSDLWGNCQNRLLVNGSFVAKNIKFLRVGNSLRDSCRREEVLPNVSCLQGSKAAEIFDFSPEWYLSKPVFTTRGGNTTNQRFSDNYDNINTLPPVL